MKKLCLSMLALSFMLIGGLTSCGPKDSTSSSTGSTPTEDAKIKIYTRDTSSGKRDGFFTTIGFEEAVKNDTVLAPGRVIVDGNGDMVNSIKNDEFGIGYASLSGLDGVNTVKYEGVEPSEETVLSGEYGLKRNFNYVVRTDYKNEDEKAIVDAFVAYMSTQEGKVTIKANGGIVDVKTTDPKWEDIKDDYPIVNEDNSDITIKFGGSTSVEKVAKALSAEFSKKCGNFVYQHAHTGSSDAYKRTQGSEKDSSNALHIGFASREFKLDGDEKCEENTYGRICIDAIAVIVNNKNNLEDINKDTLKKIYDGTITKWSEVE